jgi:hypothetical protein
MAVVPFAILFREVWKVVEQLGQLEHVELWPILEKKMHSLWLRASEGTLQEYITECRCWDMSDLTYMKAETKC